MRSLKKGVLENVTKFTGKNLCLSLFFNKVAGLQHYDMSMSQRYLFKVNNRNTSKLATTKKHQNDVNDVVLWCFYC